MIVQEPIDHWNNFAVPELREILEHCKALVRLGIAQDEEMMISIERDISLREKKISLRFEPFEPKHSKNKRQAEKQNHRRTVKKQRPQAFLLKQNA